MKSKKKNGKWYFLLIVTVAYLVIYFVSENQFVVIFNFFTKLIIQILPVFLLVYVLMILVNYFADNATLKKYMGNESGINRWMIAIVTGILSMGPVYMWYPLMKDLQKKGVKNSFLVTFLYNRGIKLQWLPVLILYFGWKYSITLLIVMLIFSVPQGIITDKLIGYKT